MKASSTSRTPIAVALAMVLTTAAAVLPASQAHAGEAYVGAGIGESHFDNKVDGVSSGNSNGVNGTLYGGYQFNKNFAVEGGFANLGHTDNNLAQSVGAHATYIDAVGFLPVANKISLLGRAGVDHVKFSSDAGHDAGTGIKVGAGAEYALTQNVSLRAEVDRYQAHAFGGDGQVNQYLIGARMAF